MRCLLLSTLALVLSAQEPIALQAPIQRVRLHPDEAWITRAGKVQLPGAGTHRILIKDLPPGLRVEDLQVAARGPAGLRLGDLSVTSEVRVVKETPEWKRLEAEREALAIKRDDLEAQSEAAQQEMTSLKGLQATHNQELSARMTYSTPSAAAVIELSKGMEGRKAELIRTERQRKRELEKLSLEEARVNAELNMREGEQQGAPSRVLLEITSTQAGPADIELGYRTQQANWRPYYEARLSEDRKRLDLVLYAAIAQKTGEAWNGVRLEISNARPNLNLSLNVYPNGRYLTWQLPVQNSPIVQVASNRKADDKVSVNFSAEQLMSLPTSRDFGGALVLAPGAAGAGRSQAASNLYRPLADEAVVQTSTLIEEARGLTKTFLVDGSKDVPADGEAHRFKVLVKDVEPNLVVFASPRLEPTAFLLARFPAPEGLPLFPGAPVVRFAGNQRLGEASMEVPASGQPFSLGFGPYKSVRTSFRRVEQKLEVVGSFTKERQWTLQDQVDLDNDGSEKLEVEVEDRMLKSGIEQVKIELLPGFEEKWAERRSGVRTWTFSMAPKEHRVLHLPVAVRAPKDGLLTGLD